MQTFGNVSLREAFGEALLAAGEQFDDLRVLDAGTSNSTMSEPFRKKWPERFYTAGINEPGMIGLATGLSMAGRRVVACDMSIFLQHAFAHLTTAARQGEDLHLIVAASHTGIAVGPDGGSAHDLTDLARMRLIPGFTVLAPWDGHQVKQALEVILNRKGCYYLRLNRPKVPIFTAPDVRFEIGKAVILREGREISIVATGDKVYAALEAADMLGDGVAEVIGVASIEPFDDATVVASAIRTGRVVTVEDHIFVGGLYERTAGVLAASHPTPMRRVALDRIFTTSGEPDELARLYGVDAAAIVEVCRKFLGVSD